MIGRHLFFVSATPSNDTTSANSGLVHTIPIPLAVSIEEPPPMATIKSASAFLQASTPFVTLVTVGFGLTSSYTS